MDIFPLLLLVFLALLSGWCFITRSNLPPGPFNFPIIGNLHRLGRHPHISLDKLSKKYGGLMHLRLGSVSTVVVSSEKAARDVYKLYKLQCASKYPFISSKYFKGMVFSGYTPQVIFQRKLINTHLFSTARLKIFEDLRRKEQQQLIRWIRDAQGRPVSFRQRIQDMNMNTIIQMLFGKHYKSIRNTDEFMQVIVDTLQVSGVFNVSDYIQALRWLDVQGLEKQYKQLVEKVSLQLRSILDDARNNPPNATAQEHAAFIDVLISLDSTEENIQDEAKLSLLFDLLLGAVDSSAVTVEWAMVELLRNPHELLKAREEIDEVVGMERHVDYSDLPKLTTIEAIAKETMRVHMVAPLPSPKIVEGGPLQLNGYTIPDGVMLLLNTHSIARDDNRWEEPFKFSPQRFLDSDIDIFGQLE